MSCVIFNRCLHAFIVGFIACWIKSSSLILHRWSFCSFIIILDFVHFIEHIITSRSLISLMFIFSNFKRTFGSIGKRLPNLRETIYLFIRIFIWCKRNILPLGTFRCRFVLSDYPSVGDKGFRSQILFKIYFQTECSIFAKS